MVQITIVGFMLGSLVQSISASVSCGNHRAASCPACMQSGSVLDCIHGDCASRLCNGDCVYEGGRCKPLSGEESDSEELPSDWPIPPDTRHKQCPNIQSFGNFSNHKVSIVIPWLGEKWLHLRDTLLSLLHFTPDEIVEEIIFVSDGNADPKEKQLKAMSPKVKVLALPSREGLIRAKTKGAKMAKGEVIVFMEGHCIVNRGWLHYLLQRLVLNPKALVTPVLDYISWDDWHSYHKAPPVQWRFEWNHVLTTSTMGGTLKDTAEVFPSPGTSGGIFAIRKDWFQHLGMFDEGLLGWGSENFEISMKVWRCGGRIENVPCSRVGHLFRRGGQQPYDTDFAQVVRNQVRVAEVWMKDHLEYFYRTKGAGVRAAPDMRVDGLEELLKKHDELGCKNLDWYLENVDFELAWEMDKLCSPDAPHGDPAKCGENMVTGRTTIKEDGLMPPSEYAKAQAAAKAREDIENAVAGKLVRNLQESVLLDQLSDL